MFVNFLRSSSKLTCLSYNISLRSMMNSEQLFPIVKQVKCENSPKLKEIKVEFVAKENLPKSEEEKFVRKEYPNDYFTTPILNWQRSFQGTFDLPPVIFGERLRPDIIHRCLLSRMAQRRNQDGIKPTKTVSTLSGSGRKPHPQKGTGRARQGKVRSNITIGGEKKHGRVARDISIKLPHKVLRFGMRSALSAKFALGEITIINNLDHNSCKTKDLAALLRKNKWGDHVLFLDTHISKEIRTSSRNIPLVYFSTITSVNIWDILRRKHIVMTPAAVETVVRLYHPDRGIRKALFKKLLKSRKNSETSVEEIHELEEEQEDSK